MAAVIDRVGTWYRFGEFGPLYEVVGEAAAQAGESMMHIRVLNTGEELDFPLREILADPREA